MSTGDVLGRQFHDIEHGPETPEALHNFGLHPDTARFHQENVPLSKIHGVYHRDDIEDDDSYEHVKELEPWVGALPPVILSDPDKTGKHYIIDGHHRTSAYHSTGQTHIPAYVPDLEH